MRAGNYKIFREGMYRDTWTEIDCNPSPPDPIESKSWWSNNASKSLRVWTERGRIGLTRIGPNLGRSILERDCEPVHDPSRTPMAPAPSSSSSSLSFPVINCWGARGNGNDKSHVEPCPWTTCYAGNDAQLIIEGRVDPKIESRWVKRTKTNQNTVDLLIKIPNVHENKSFY